MSETSYYKPFKYPIPGVGISLRNRVGYFYFMPITLKQFLCLKYPDERLNYLWDNGKFLEEELFIGEFPTLRKTYSLDDFFVDVTYCVRTNQVNDVFAMSLDEFISCINLKELLPELFDNA